MDKVKTIFMGSGEFALPVLKQLLDLDFIDLVAVITQPDKPFGRNKVLTPTPVGGYFSNLDCSADLLEPVKIKLDADEILRKYSPELIIVASYGQIIPVNMIEYPKYKCLNLHGSILPKLRGAVPVQMSILQGFESSGVTMQVMVDKMDEGPIVSVREINIDPDETTETLMDKLSNLGAEILREDLIKWIKGEIKALPQDDSLATYCYKTDLSKEKAEITLETSITEADRMIRAFYPWPVAWVRLPNHKTLKIYKALISNEKIKGNLIIRDGKKLYLCLKDGCLELIEVQLEGKNRGKAHDYLYLSSLF